MRGNFAAQICFLSTSTTVGYNTVTIDKQYQLIAVNFDDVDGVALTIQKAFPVSEGMTSGNALANADQIQVMNAIGGYDQYYLSNGYNGKASTPATANKWVKNTARTVATEDTVGAGTAFWYVSKNGATNPYTITVAGSVLMSSNESTDLSQTYSLVGSPYPIEIPLNDCIVAVNGTAGNALANADQIQIMNESGGYDQYYLSNGYNGKASTPATANKWVKNTARTIATEDKFPVGKGAWFVRKSASTELKFINPAAPAQD